MLHSAARGIAQDWALVALNDFKMVAVSSSCLVWSILSKMSKHDLVHWLRICQPALHWLVCMIAHRVVETEVLCFRKLHTKLLIIKP